MNAIQKYISNQGLELLPDTKQWINRFEIQSESSNRVYIVAQRANYSEWGCSCMGWKRYRHCKHLDAIMPMLKRAESLNEIAQ